MLACLRELYKPFGNIKDTLFHYGYVANQYLVLRIAVEDSYLILKMLL